jgi:hemoglobin
MKLLAEQVLRTWTMRNQPKAHAEKTEFHQEKFEGALMSITITAPFQHRAQAVGLTEAAVREVVFAFYHKVRIDEVLGPIFEEALGDDWGPHIENICLFWLTATRLGSGYKAGNFIPAHMKHASILQEQMLRWLHLFRETAVERCTQEAAAALIDIAERMADSIRVSLSRRADAATRL